MDRGLQLRDLEAFVAPVTQIRYRQISNTDTIPPGIKNTGYRLTNDLSTAGKTSLLCSTFDFKNVNKEQFSC